MATPISEVPAGAAFVTNIKGDIGTFEVATGETVPYTDVLSIEITGARGENVHFKIPATAPSAETVSSDTATAEWVGSDGSLTGPAVQARVDASVEPVYGELARTTAPVRRIEAGIDGVTGLASVDDSAAIQAIFNEAGKGGTVVVGSPGVNREFLLENTVQVTNGQQRFVGGGADMYSSSFRRDTPGTMFEVKAPGFISREVSLKSGNALQDSAVVGFHLLGQAAGDIDATLDRVCFYRLEKAVVMQGRNLRAESCLFSQNRYGIWVGGKDETYHNTNFDTRNLLAYQNRFHATGEGITSGASAGIHIAPEGYVHRLSVIAGNVFDIPRPGRDISIVGTAALRHEHIMIRDNAHFQSQVAAVFLDQTSRISVDGEHIAGYNNTGTEFAYQVWNSVLHNASDVSAWNNYGGMLLNNVADARLMNVLMSNNTKEGFNFGAGVSNIRLFGTTAKGNVGWGYYSGATTAEVKGIGVEASLNTAGQITPALTSLTAWA